MITERINIDVRPGGVPIVVHVTQYEVGLRTFEFVPFTSSGEWTDVTGSATLEGTKPDGNAFQQACTYVDGIVTYVLQEQLCAVSGRVWSRLVIRNIDGDMIGMTAIVWDVGEAGVADDAVMSDSDISALRQFLDEFGTIDAYRGALNGALAAVGAPLVAATASAMTDTTKVYVYTGSESGYTEGHWYYWNGSAWTDGGVYQSTGINTDKTLTVEDMAADAKATGDAVAELKNDLTDEFESIGVVATVSPNLLNPDEVEVGRITSSSSNVLHTGSYDTDYVTTGFMPVEEGEKYGFHINKDASIRGVPVSNIWAYDSNKAGLSYLGNIGYNADGLRYITAPTGCKYIRASLSTANYNISPPVMFSEVDGTSAPSEIYPYGTEYKLTGFVDDETFGGAVHDIENIQTIIDNNFVPEWGETEGTVTEGKFIESNGVVTDITGNYSIRTLPVTPYEQYKISAKAYYRKYYYAFYDEQNTFISGHSSTENGITTITDELVTAPANASTLVVGGGTNGTNAVIKIIAGYVTSDKYPWINKKWVVVGDSLTQVNEATSIHYFDYIADDSGITPYNMGVGGTGYCRGYDSNRAFYQRISAIPTDADVVTVFGSGNDMNIAVMPIFDGKTWAEALGTFSDTGTDTICGCVNTFLDNYFAVMTTVPIGIIAPTPWMSYPTTLLANNKFEDYTNALKQIAEYRGVPFLDLYHHSNLRPENEANRNACFYGGASLDGNGDGVHPNELGHKIIAPKIYEFVKSILLD